MRRMIFILFVVATLVSCDNTGVPEFHSQLLADVTSDSLVQYVGDARFHTAQTSRNNLPLFQLTSENRANRGVPTDGYESLGFEAWRELLEVGTYDVSDRGTVFLDPSPIWMTYLRAADDSIETYSSVSGTLEITFSSYERVDGTFAFDALLYCKRSQDPDAPREDPCDVWDLDPSRSRIAVVGSFVAIRMRYDDTIFVDQSVVEMPDFN
jgi:hypothetical protein